MFKKISEAYRAFVMWVKAVVNIVKSHTEHEAKVEALEAEHAAAVETLKLGDSNLAQALRFEVFDAVTALNESLSRELAALRTKYADLDSWAERAINTKYGPTVKRKATE